MTAPGPFRVETTDEGERMVVDRDGRLLTYIFPDRPDDGASARLLAASWELAQAHELHLDGPRLLLYAARLLEETHPEDPVSTALRRRAALAAEAARHLRPPIPVVVVGDAKPADWRVKRSWWWFLRRRWR